MSTGTSTKLAAVTRIATYLAVALGVVTVGYGLLLFPVSLLAGFHVVAIGVSLALAGLVATDRAANRFDLSPATQRNLSLALALVAGVLLVLFVVVNVASFEQMPIESEGSSGN